MTNGAWSVASEEDVRWILTRTGAVAEIVARLRAVETPAIAQPADPFEGL